MSTDPIFRNRPIPALAVICLGVFVISVDATIVNVALPTLSRELGADTAQLQWIVDAYTLVMSGLMLSAGSLSDRYGRRGSLSLGLALFAITSGSCGPSEFGGRTDRGAGRHGCGRSGDLPDHPGTDHQHLHRSGAARQSDRTVGGHGGCRGGRGTDQRRLVARALLVGLDLHGEHSDRGAGRRRRHLVRSDLARPGGAARRRTRLDPVRGRDHGTCLHRHRGAHVGMDQHADRDRVCLGRNRSRRRSRSGSGAAPIPCWTSRCFSIVGSPAAAWR